MRIHAKGETGFQTEVREKRVARESDRLILPTKRDQGKSTSRSLSSKVPILFQVSEDDEGNGREARALSRSYFMS